MERKPYHARIIRIRDQNPSHQEQMPHTLYYLDYAATAPLDDAVKAYMHELLDDDVSVSWGNPSSSHYYGEKSRQLVLEARMEVATLLNCQKEEIIFTSCATESIHWALVNSALHLREKFRTNPSQASAPGHIITTDQEHPATLCACHYLQEEHGFHVTIIPCHYPQICGLQDVLAAVKEDTLLCSMMVVCNVNGVFIANEAICGAMRSRGIRMHIDASQAVGKCHIVVNPPSGSGRIATAAPTLYMDCDLLTFAAHKFGGPRQGVLYVREGVLLPALLRGGGQERTLRAGTENVLTIAGCGRACQVVRRQLDSNWERVMQLTTDFRQRLEARIDGEVLVWGGDSPKVPHILSLHFAGLEGRHLQLQQRLAALGICCSNGSACHSVVATDDAATSPTFQKGGDMENENEQGRNALQGEALRCSMGTYLSEVQCQQAAEIISNEVNEMLQESSGTNS